MAQADILATQQAAAERINASDVDGAVELLFAVDAVDHDPAPGQATGREGFRGFFRSLVAAFPDAHLEAQAVVADADHVALAYTLTGTHHGDFNGVAPTGRSIHVRGLQIGRFAGGQIVERWGSSDELGILTPLGAAPKAGGQLGDLVEEVRGDT